MLAVFRGITEFKCVEHGILVGSLRFFRIGGVKREKVLGKETGTKGRTWVAVVVVVFVFVFWTLFKYQEYN